jgi:hypothetical protein
MKNYQLLTKYGLTDFFLNQLSNKAEKKELIGRIVSSHKKYYNIITNTQDVKGIIKGSFLHHKNIFLTNLPAVGDFVVLNDSQHPDYATPRFATNRFATNRFATSRFATPRFSHFFHQ